MPPPPSNKNVHTHSDVQQQAGPALRGQDEEAGGGGEGGGGGAGGGGGEGQELSERMECVSSPSNKTTHINSEQQAQDGGATEEKEEKEATPTGTVPFVDPMFEDNDPTDPKPVLQPGLDLASSWRQVDALKEWKLRRVRADFYQRLVLKEGGRDSGNEYNDFDRTWCGWYLDGYGL